ncbi:MAG: tRNA (N(6)-L-threonylcarbamoyladenosine(37)-C(2))-methylthiotransferase MtaB [Desulfitobacteriaceae bacterium]
MGLEQNLERAVCLVTLGCKVNQTEGEAVAQLFRGAGYRVVNSEEPANVVVINTCTVTNTGGSKSRQMIRKMIKAHPESFVVVMGCYAQTAPGDVLGIEGVDLVLGTQDRGRILEFIREGCEEEQPQSVVHNIMEAKDFEELPLLEEESRTRATLKIEEGCNQFCTYCIIPYARGPVRSRLPENALAEARKLVEAGYKEVVLTGIHTGAYGQDFDAEWNLARLVREFGQIPGLERLRLSSIEPMEVTPDLISAIEESPIICRHLHIPLQSGSAEILAKMKRPYTLEDYSALLERLKRILPGLAVTTDVIVGFPGEKEEHHRQALAYTEACAFAGIHVFPYSKREGTPAALYPNQLSNAVKQERSREMLAAARRSQERYKRHFLGQTMKVLIETVDTGGVAFGHTENYLGVNLLASENEKGWEPGNIVSIELNERNLDI